MLEAKLGEGHFDPRSVYQTGYPLDPRIFGPNKTFVWRKCVTTNIVSSDRTENSAEVDLLKTIEHENIERYVDIFYTENGSLQFGMDFPELGTLEIYVRQPGCDSREFNIWRFIAHISSALKYLHTLKPKSILHRDLNPANVFGHKIKNPETGYDELHWKIANVGLLKLYDENNQGRHYTAPSSPVYFAPEV